MPKHPRLRRRGVTYYHRAAIPADIADSYPKTEETFTLGTKDYQEAVRRVRVAAAEVDRRFEAHRRMLAQKAKPPLKELSDEEIKRIGEVYYTYLLEEDEAIRSEQFSEGERPSIMLDADADVNEIISAHGFRPPSFEGYAEDKDAIDELTRHYYARGKVNSFYKGEAEEVLTWEGISANLDPASPSWRKLARELQAATIKATKAVRLRNEGEVVETPRVPGLRPESRVPLLSMAVEQWVEEKARTSWVAKTKREHCAWMGHFIAAIGDRPLDAYTKTDARAYKGMLLKLPANWVKFSELQGLSLDKASAKAHELGMEPMTESNVNKLLGFVGSFWTWASDQYDEASVNPFKGLKIKQRKRIREERDPFSVQELGAIFSAPIYTGCASLREWKRPGVLVPRNSGMFWVPLISLFTGARMGEVIQLYVDDVRDEGGIFFLDLNDNGEDKRLKTTYSQRSIPIHASILDMGFMDHVELCRSKGQKRLFSDLAMGEDGYYSTPFSKHFSRFLRAVGIKNRKNAFHSFRHSFEDACRDSDIPKEIMDALQGHGQEGMSERYGRGYYLKKLDEAMKRLQYRDLDLSHLNVLAQKSERP